MKVYTFADGTKHKGLMACVKASGFSRGAVHYRYHKNLYPFSDKVPAIIHQHIVLADGRKFPSLCGAARACGLSVKMMQYRLDNQLHPFTDTPTDIKVHNCKPVWIAGKRYGSIRAAADAIGITYATLKSRLRAARKGDNVVDITDAALTCKNRYYGEGWVDAQGIKYKSGAEMAAALGVKTSLLTKWRRLKRHMFSEPHSPQIEYRAPLPNRALTHK